MSISENILQELVSEDKERTATVALNDVNLIDSTEIVVHQYIGGGLYDKQTYPFDTFFSKGKYGFHHNLTAAMDYALDWVQENDEPKGDFDGD